MKKKVCYLMILAVLILEMSFQKYNIAAAKENKAKHAETRQTEETSGSEEAQRTDETNEDTETQQTEETGEGKETQQTEETSESTETQPSKDGSGDAETETQTTEEGSGDTETEMQSTEESVEGAETQTTEESSEGTETQTTEETDDDEETQDIIPPSITLINENKAVSQGKDDADIYNDGEFIFEISDDSGTEDLDICLKGVDDDAGIIEDVSLSDSGENLQYTIKLPDNTYGSDIYLSVIDKAGNETNYQLFKAEKNIIDTAQPVMKAEILEGSDKRRYEGGPTNQQLEIRVSAVAASGIESFEMAFVPESEDTTAADSLEWEKVSLEDDTYSMIIGEKLERKEGFDKNAEVSELEVVEQNAADEVDEAETMSISNISQTPSQLKLSIKNGTYYFRAKSYAGFENEEEARINQQQRSIEINPAVIDKKPDASGWYNINTGKPSVWVDALQNKELAEEECGYKLTMHMAIYKGTADAEGEIVHTSQNIITVKNDIPLEKTQPSEKAIEPFEISEEGVYTLYVWGNDNAGNYSETQKYIINADYTAPEKLAITVGGEDMTNSGNDTGVIYKKFFDTEADVEVTGYDALSQIDDSKTVLTIKSSGDSGETMEGKRNAVASIGHRYYVEAKLYDKAGNMSEVRSDGFVADNQAPGGKNEAELTIIPKGANENGFFNDDFALELYVRDNPESGSSSLKNVSYILSGGDGKLETQQLFSFDAANATDSQLDANSVFEGELKIKASDYEGEETFIELTAVDNAGNTSTVQKPLKIDTTDPQIELEFDDSKPQNGIYYKMARSATVTIYEKNFDIGGVSFEITKDGSSITGLEPTADQWTSDGDTHTVSITFEQDGEYDIKIKCIDMADNESVYAEADRFVIDTTLPEISVSYDKTAYSEGWYNTNLTAEIKIVEHNFKAESFKLTAQPELATTRWKTDGDIHTAKIIFDTDGEYTYTINCVDLAGNHARPAIKEHFTIDTQQPRISINGVQDNSANSSEVTPLISITDTNIDDASIMIAMTDGWGNEIELQSSTTQLEHGFAYRLTNVSEQPDSVYHLEVSASDMSGNQSTTGIRFSLNRHGSSYDITDAVPIISKMYNKYENLHDIRLIETNLDEVEQFNIYMNRNGNMLKSVNTDKKPWKFNKNKLYYTTKRYGSPELGYMYEYIIYKENFQKEGSYKLTFSSIDKAGNHVNNTLGDKEAQISFIVDDTPPAVYIDGAKLDKPYNVDSISASVYITDNFKLEKAELYLENEAAERINTWDYIELVQNVANPDKGVMLELPAGKGQTLLFCVRDCAGNEIVTFSDNVNKEVQEEILINDEATAKSRLPLTIPGRPRYTQKTEEADAPDSDIDTTSSAPLILISFFGLISAAGVTVFLIKKEKRKTVLLHKVKIFNK